MIEKFWNDSKASPNTKSFMIAFATGSKKNIDDKFKNTYIKTGVILVRCEWITFLGFYTFY